MRKKCSKVQYDLTIFRKFSHPNIFSPTQMKKKCSDFMFFTYVGEKMSHLHIYLQLDTFSNFYFTFDIFEIIFWAIVCCLVLLKNWQICGLGILYPLMIDISFIPSKTFTISIILNKRYLNALGMNQWGRSGTARIKRSHSLHSSFSP